MKMKYSRRDAESILKDLAAWYPVLAITGPRQSGKTTLARHAFPGKPYVSLEDIDRREHAASDPRSFLAQFPDGAVLDEAQRAPALFSYLQTVVDADPRRGRFVLTGSQQFGLRDGISQSLAGRVGLLELLPFALNELAGIRAAASLEEQLWRGAYPPIYDHGIPPDIWLPDYVSTYLEKDVRRLINVQDMAAFQRFLRMCAARSGQLLNLSALAADCGITHNTARSWLSVLEASYIVYLLQPYHRNFGKRLVKTPKLYFLDTGLAAWLANVRRPADIALANLRGPLFETLVVGELLKARLNRRQDKNLYFWRDSNGNEIDIVLESGGRLYPIECKAGETVAGDWFSPIERFLDTTGQSQAWLVYGGAVRQERRRCAVVGWRELPDLAAMLSSIGDVP